MIIRSNFKDYYDYVSHIHGKDPKDIVYVRNHQMELPAKLKVSETTPSGFRGNFKIKTDGEINKRIKDLYRRDVYKSAGYRGGGEFKVPFIQKNVEMIKEAVNAARADQVVTYPQSTLFKITGDNIRYLVVAGQLYLIFLNELVGVSLLLYEKSISVDDIDLQNDLLWLSREIGQPVFIIDSVSASSYMEVTIKTLTPRLGEVGFSAVYTPEGCYQLIDCYLRNAMRTTPDNEVPVVLEDKDRLVKAGFDIKKSFRHRI